MLPNRIALYLTAVGDLAAAVAPFVLDFGGSEKIVAYVGSIIALNAVVVTWLNGWSRYELQEANRDAIPQDPHTPVGFDKPGT